MPLIVDGDNLLGTWPGRSRSDEERRDLSRALTRQSRILGRRIVVVFDGRRPDLPPPSGDILYSGGGRSADDLILAFLGKERAPREWTVVTSDRSLGDRCHHLGARVERCDLFRKKLRRSSSGEKPSGSVDVGEWLEYFGLEEGQER
jgi:predicted RNA-binding protein with PIN domain